MLTVETKWAERIAGAVYGQIQLESDPVARLRCLAEGAAAILQATRAAPTCSGGCGRGPYHLATAVARASRRSLTVETLAPWDDDIRPCGAVASAFARDGLTLDLAPAPSEGIRAVIEDLGQSLVACADEPRGAAPERALSPEWLGASARVALQVVEELRPGRTLTFLVHGARAPAAPGASRLGYWLPRRRWHVLLGKPWRTQAHRRWSEDDLRALEAPAAGASMLLTHVWTGTSGAWRGHRQHPRSSRELTDHELELWGPPHAAVWAVPLATRGGRVAALACWPLPDLAPHRVIEHLLLGYMARRAFAEAMERESRCLEGPGDLRRAPRRRSLAVLGRVPRRRAVDLGPARANEGAALPPRRDAVQGPDLAAGHRGGVPHEEAEGRRGPRSEDRPRAGAGRAGGRARCAEERAAARGEE